MRLDTIGYDAARTPVTRTYTRTSDGTTVASDLGTLNHRGQWINRQGNGRSLSCQYDSIGRLTRVDDSSDVTGACTRRIYAYDTHSNRTGFGQTSNVAGDPRPAEPTVTTATTYDSADRLMTTAGANGSSWTYDPFGRTTLMPTGYGSATVANTFYVDQSAWQHQRSPSSPTLSPATRSKQRSPPPASRLPQSGRRRGYSRASRKGSGRGSVRWQASSASCA